tara:strand:+ start:2580 stop:2816 length:237 start_codon:yes stop_codon:yes gene_type:complete
MKKISITLSVNNYEMAERLEHFLNTKTEKLQGLSPDDPNYVLMTNNFEERKEFWDYCDNNQNRNCTSKCCVGKLERHE